MPTTETNVNNEIRRLLTLDNDDGRAVRVCETCGGKGSRQTTGRYGPPVDIECHDCKHGYIENRERIAAAAKEWWRDHDTRPYQDVTRPALNALSEANVAFDSREPFRRSLWLWENRHNQPWQSALEEFVIGQECENCRNLKGTVLEDWRCLICGSTGRIGGWREDAPDYDSPEGMVELKRLLREAGYGFEIHIHACSKLYFAVLMNPCGTTNYLAQRNADTEHTSLYEAVKAALGIETPAFEPE